MAVRKHSRLFKRFLHELGNKGSEKAIGAYLSTHFVEHQATPPSAPTGRDGIRELFLLMRRGLPDLTIRFDDVFQADDRVVARLTWTGTHNGELFGIPATGRTVSFPSIEIARFEGDRIVEHWGVSDRSTLMMQLGTPAPRNVYVKNRRKAERASATTRVRAPRVRSVRGQRAPSVTR